MNRHFGQFEQTLLYAVLSLQDADGGANGPSIRKLIEAQTGRAVSPGAIYTALTRLDWALARVAEGDGALAGKFRHPSVAPYIRAMQRQVTQIEALLA